MIYKHSNNFIGSGSFADAAIIIRVGVIIVVVVANTNKLIKLIICN
jgi:hypothetical protein